MQLSERTGSPFAIIPRLINKLGVTPLALTNWKTEEADGTNEADPKDPSHSFHPPHPFEKTVSACAARVQDARATLRLGCLLSTIDARSTREALKKHKHCHPARAKRVWVPSGDR